MKTLNLKIDLEGVKLSEVDKLKSAQEICVAVIKNLLLLYGQQQKGFDESNRRKFYKISDALDESIKTHVDSVLLEDDWMTFLKLAFKEIKIMPDPLLRKVEEIVSGKD